VLDALGRIDTLVGLTLTEVAQELGARAVALRGARLAVLHPAEVRIHDAAGSWSIPAPGASLLDLALSPDGRRVAASDLDGLIHVWDTATGSLLGLLPGHTERVVAIEFLPDGDLLSASWDKSARVWSLDALVRPVEVLTAKVAGAWGPPDAGSPAHPGY
jgi:WD40 repeat protein